MRLFDRHALHASLHAVAIMFGQVFGGAVQHAREKLGQLGYNEGGQLTSVQQACAAPPRTEERSYTMDKLVTLDGKVIYELDSLDKKLIHLLELDAGQSSRTLATQLNISPTTASQRIQKMIQAGVLHLTARVDAQKIGLQLVVVFVCEVAPNKVSDAVQLLTRCRQITWLSTITGRWNLMARGSFRNNEALTTFLKDDLARIEGLRTFETFVCIEQHVGPFIPI
ncbi:MAG: Lrp/AsnC family transcriptional regulator [Chloroflexota bacterium]|nr:MAG: Lrp/AsnC family transcriptional regulator [Chloroflexota bacterium]